LKRNSTEKITATSKSVLLFECETGSDGAGRRARWLAPTRGNTSDPGGRGLKHTTPGQSLENSFFIFFQNDFFPVHFETYDSIKSSRNAHNAHLFAQFFNF
jgi:hypothetical protein